MNRGVSHITSPTPGPSRSSQPQYGQQQYGQQQQGQSSSSSPQPQQQQHGWRPTTLTHDEDGVPLRWLKVLQGKVSPNALSLQDKAELFGLCDMLAAKEKYQKAADLLYPCVMSDTHNVELKAKWVELIHKTNVQLVGQEAARRQQSDRRHERIEEMMKEKGMSETARWNDLKAKGVLPPDKPNWALGRLMPWQTNQALALGQAAQTRAQVARNPFEKIAAYDEACRMYNQVLSVSTRDEEARKLLGECVAAMNHEYQEMKKVKRQDRALNPFSPATAVGDFYESKNPWVKKIKG